LDYFYGIKIPSTARHRQLNNMMEISKLGDTARVA
jgi:hypothetical protein